MFKFDDPVSKVESRTVLVPGPTFAEFFRRLEGEFGVRVLPAPSPPFHQPNEARVLVRTDEALTFRVVIEFRFATDRMAPDLIRSKCEGLALDPVAFGVRPRGRG